MEAAGAAVVLLAAATFLCLWVFFDLWLLWVVFGGAEPVASCARTKPEVAAKKATAIANTIDFFMNSSSKW